MEESATKDFLSDKVPIVSFASKPRLSKKSSTSGSTDAPKRPAFIVVRKKATTQAKKKLSDVKSFTSHENAAVNIIQNTDAGDVSNKPATETPPSSIKKVDSDELNFPHGKSKDISVAPKSVAKKSTWTVSDQSKNSAQHSNSGVISSLFLKNPEIPVVEKDNVETTKENVFSAQSFGSLNIHKHLVSGLLFEYFDYN